MGEDNKDGGAPRRRTPEPPPFNPDIELIGHREGSRYWRRKYREAAVELRDRLLKERAERLAARPVTPDDPS